MQIDYGNPYAPQIRELPYEAPVEGQNYWVFDDVLPNAADIRERCLNKSDWLLGFPHRQETWPGRRAIPALEPAELEVLEARVREATGSGKLWVETAPGGARLNHNCVQVVGGREGQVRPHTDSRQLCKYAAVLYLTPNAPKNGGTSFFRQRMPNGKMGGNQVVAPNNNMIDALGTRFVPPNAFVEDKRIKNQFNRLLVYTASMIHSATAYFGQTMADERMAAVFFWMA